MTSANRSRIARWASALALVPAFALALGNAEAGPRSKTSNKKSRRAASAATATIPESLPSAPDAMALVEARARMSTEIPGIRDKSARRPDYVETEKFDVERLSRGAVEQVIIGHLDDLAACHERYASASDGGSFTLDLVIEPAGMVSSAKVTSDGAAQKKLASCMARAARNWSFPAADGETEVSYPLAFNSTQ